MVGMLPRFTARHVHRPRLVARLDAAGAAAVIHAPSGYGKSLLLAEWAAQPRDERLVVLQASSETSTRRAFWTALLDAAHSALDLSPEHPIAGARAFAGEGEGFREALPRLFEALPGAVALIVDGFEHVADAAEVVADLRHLLHYRPELRLLLATRRWTPLQDALTSLVLDVETIGPEALCFTLDETRACLDGVSPAALELVQRVTGGVPLLVRLSAIERELSGRDATDERALEERIAAHFREAMAHAGDASAGLGIEDSLLAVAGADLVDAELAGALSGAPGAETIERLELLGLGTVLELRVPSGRLAVLQLPPPLRAILRDIAREADAPRYRSTRREFAMWARGHELWVEALIAAVDAADLALVSEILLENCADFLAIHAGVISAALHDVEPAQLQRWPAVAAAIAIDCFWQPDMQPRIRGLLAAAVAGIRERAAAATPEERFVYATIELLAVRFGDPEEGDGRQLALRAVAALRALDAPQRRRLRGVIPDAVNQIAGTLLFFGDPAAALEVLRLQRPDGASSDGARFRYLTLSLQAEGEAYLGDMVAAARTIERAAADYDERFANRGFVVSPVLLAETLRDLERGEYEAAAEGLRRAGFSRPEVESAYLYWDLAAWAAIGTGEASALLADLERAREDMRRRRDVSAHTTAHLDRSAARLALAAGDLTRARSLIASVDELGAVEAGIARAQLLLIAGRADQAMTELVPLRAATALTPRQEARVGLIHVAALLDSADPGAPDAARMILTRIGSLLASHGMTLPLLALGREAGRGVVDAGRDAGIAFYQELPDRVLAAIDRSFPALAVPQLTRREHEVLEALLVHPGYQQIADALHVSKDTVKTQLRSVYRKLGVSSRDAAIAAAIGLGFPDA